MLPFVNQNPFIKNSLSPQEIEALNKYFDYGIHKKGSYLFKENQRVKNLYYIEKGLVKLTYQGESDKDFILAFAFEDWWETDFEAFLNQSKSKYALQCIEETTTYSITLDQFNEILEKFKLADFFLKKSMNGHMASQHRIISLLTNKPRERYEHFITLYPTLVQRLPKSVLAQFLGVSRETLSRLYQKVKK